MDRSKKILLSFILALATIISVTRLWEKNLTLTLVLLLISALNLSIWKGEKYIYLYVVAGILGALSEAYAISYGVWTYANPDFIGIPMWLPFLWGEASLFIISLSFQVKKYLEERK
jgi:hypothetical protein